MNQIHEGLDRAFARFRMVFWYDPTGEWHDHVDAFESVGITKLHVQGTEFATKVRMATDVESQFLVYLPSARPADADNWLLDLLLEGYQYQADRASLALLDLGLSDEFRGLAESHAAFFGNARRVSLLREQLTPREEPRDVRLRMMAILAGGTPEVDGLLLRFLSQDASDSLSDVVQECFASAKLVEPFWREVERLFAYHQEQPSLRDFAVTLFRGANPLDVTVKLNAHAKVFLQRWKDSQAHAQSYASWAGRMQGDLQLQAALTDLEDSSLIGSNDTFELFERFTLHRAARDFAAGVTTAELRPILEQRRSSFWRRAHASSYEAIEAALNLRDLLAGLELSIDSIDDGIGKYVGHWWQVDTAYRHCLYHLKKSSQVNVMEPIRDWVERHYLNDFLLPVADRWSDRVNALTQWSAEAVMPQRQFFDQWVYPYRARGQKVFVIISDALRYEAAMEFAGRIRGANRWSAEVSAMFGAAPSYTQVGMAALLPGHEREVDADGNVSVDGRSATGTANRTAILANGCEGRATAVLAEAFLDMNSKGDGRALARDHDVIYIYHNRIDAVGDKAGTEGQTFNAVAEAIAELEEIVKKVANVNGTHVLLTADHGFLFQQDPVDEGDMVYLPSAGSLTSLNRRYALGQYITANPRVKVFDAASLHLKGNWSAAFPTSLGRFPLKGSGKRYVHGGLSLQEVIIPVVRIHKARTDDVSQVEVESLRMPSKITTAQVAIALYQDRPVLDKVQPRTLRIGVFSNSATLLSEQKTVVFDSREAEARLREVPVLLLLGGLADQFNNSDVDLRLEEQLSGTSQWVTYRSYPVRLQKPFANDFDEF